MPASRCTAGSSAGGARHVPATSRGCAERRFEQGRQEAWKKEQELLLEGVRALPDGEPKAEETERMIDRVRAFIGYRGHGRQTAILFIDEFRCARAVLPSVR